MTLNQLFSSVCRRRPCPVLTPTALSMSLVIGLFAVALSLPDRADQQVATAGELMASSAGQATPTQPLSLRDRLIVGLRARIPSEIAYVDAVVENVQQGRLPQRMVDETFFWARQHAAARSGRVRPIIYFQPAMTIRAERLGIEL